MNSHAQQLGRLFATVSLLALAGCASSSREMVQETPAPAQKAPSTLDTHLAPAWISKATHIATGAYHVYYQGTAKGEYQKTGTGQSWSGTIEGDVMIIDKLGATIMTSGAVVFVPGGGFSTRGRATTFIAEEPLPWRTLLRS